MQEITVKELTDFLNKRTNGFSCPICRKQEWQVEQHNGFVSNAKLMSEAELARILTESIRDYGGEVPEQDDEGEMGFESDLIADIAIVRCGYCGWLAFFHKKLIEEKIHGKK